MTTRTITEPILDAEARLEGFDNLMPFKVRGILPISSSGSRLLLTFIKCHNMKLCP